MVLVLMGIVLSMMTLSVGDGGKYRQLEEEAQRLKTLISLAKDEVIIHSQDWTLVFKENGYLFEREDLGQKFGQDKDEDKDEDKKADKGEGTPKKKMVPIEDSIFRTRELPDYRLSLVIEDEVYAVSIQESDEDEEGTIGRIEIYSSGEMTEFELTIRAEEGDDHFVLKGTANGELSLKSSRDDEI